MVTASRAVTEHAGVVDFDLLRGSLLRLDDQRRSLRDRWPHAMMTLKKC